MSHPLSTVALGSKPELRFFILDVARLLKSRFGSVIHMYAYTDQQVAFYKEQNKDGLLASINNAGLLLTQAMKPVDDEAEETRRAKHYEDLLGVTYNRLAVGNRHLGRGYALGGFHHPRSRQSEKVSYGQMLRAYNDSLAYWEGEHIEKGITTSLNTPPECAFLCDVQGIHYRAMTGSRFENYHTWAWNAVRENPLFVESFERLKDKKFKTKLTVDSPYLSHQVSKRIFLQRTSFAHLLYDMGMMAARYAYWNLRGYEKAKGYYALDMLRIQHRCWTELRRLRKIAVTQLSDLENTPFVYYALANEPEASLQGLSPEYFYQLSSIAAVSRDLPAGTLLAVKEALGAVGRRPDNFYQQILDMKNVVMIDPTEYGLACAQAADAVVTITGTAGLEAAVPGKPVITFGRHNAYNILPHVKVVTDEAQLKEQLATALDGSHDRQQAIQDAQRYLHAIISESFDMGRYDYVDLHGFDAEAVEACCDLLARSLTSTTARAWIETDRNNVGGKLKAAV